ncbi:hypothetical protein TWF281_001290, partial [Arthrobotrys megalospora]
VVIKANYGPSFEAWAPVGRQSGDIAATAAIQYIKPSTAEPPLSMQLRTYYSPYYI